MWDVIVVGAGVEGSATAYQSAKAGYKTLLLEQVSFHFVYHRSLDKPHRAMQENARNNQTNILIALANSLPTFVWKGC